MLIDATSRYAELRLLLEWTIIAIGIQVFDWTVCFGRSRSIGWVIDRLNGSTIQLTVESWCEFMAGTDWNLHHLPCRGGGSRDRSACCFGFLKIEDRLLIAISGTRIGRIYHFLMYSGI